MKLRLDAAHILRLVGADEGVAPGLAFCLALDFKIHEQAHAGERIASLRQRGVVRDLKQIHHGVGKIMTAEPGASRGLRASRTL